MNPKRFLAGLGITVAIQLLVCILLLYWIPAMRIHAVFILMTILVMLIFCLSLYVAARVIVKSSFTRLFIQLVMMAVFIKLFLCVVLVIAYKKVYEPADISFIWPFLFIYITSTIYEVIFLEKVGRQKNNTAA